MTQIVVTGAELPQSWDRGAGQDAKPKTQQEWYDQKRFGGLGTG